MSTAKLLVEVYCDSCVISRKIIVGDLGDPLNEATAKNKIRSLGWTITKDYYANEYRIQCKQCSDAHR